MPIPSEEEYKPETGLSRNDLKSQIGNLKTFQR
jgi:hypothetical protein